MRGPGVRPRTAGRYSDSRPLTTGFLAPSRSALPRVPGSAWKWLALARAMVWWGLLTLVGSAAQRHVEGWICDLSRDGGRQNVLGPWLTLAHAGRCCR